MSKILDFLRSLFLGEWRGKFKSDSGVTIHYRETLSSTVYWVDPVELLNSPKIHKQLAIARQMYEEDQLARQKQPSKSPRARTCACTPAQED